MKEALRNGLAVLGASGVAIGLAVLVLSGPVQAQTPSAASLRPGSSRRDRCR